MPGRRHAVTKIVFTRAVILPIVFILLTMSSCSGGISDAKIVPTPTGTILGRVTGTTATPTGLKLVWSDEFDGPKGTPPDPSKWTPDIAGDGWYHHQLDYDTNNQNVYQDGQGNLVLEARKGDATGYQCWYGSCQYTSARISTRGHFSFTYGRLEARIKIPFGQGIWSAFWLFGTNCAIVGWPACGEIDVMENIGKEPGTIYGTAHGPGLFTGTYTMKQGNFSDNFHIFTLQWDNTSLKFFVDGNNYATLERNTLQNQQDWVYDHPFNIILNLAVGGDWPGEPNYTTAFPQKMYISYVRLYASK
jgi:beta-glucanase (GH16 family)